MISSTRHDDGVVEVVVDHPPVNALPVQGWFDLAEAILSAGRDPDTFDLGVFGCPGDERSIDGYAEMGFGRCVLGLPPTGESAALKALDSYAAVIERYGRTASFEGLVT